MSKKYYKDILTVLALAAFFGALVFMPAFAADSTQITNSASASSNTGGQDGADGEDGKDGQDGADGASGANGQSINMGDSSASAYIKTNIDGEDVVNIEKGETSTGGGTTTAEVHTGATASGSAAQTTELPSEINVASSSIAEIMQVLSTIREILMSYASKLF